MRGDGAIAVDEKYGNRPGCHAREARWLCNDTRRSDDVGALWWVKNSFFGIADVPALEQDLSQRVRSEDDLQPSSPFSGRAKG